MHTLRHTFATHQVHNGLKINQLKEVLGHKKMETTYKYVHLDRTNLRQEMEQGRCNLEFKMTCLPCHAAALPRSKIQIQRPSLWRTCPILLCVSKDSISSRLAFCRSVKSRADTGTCWLVGSSGHRQWRDGPLQLRAGQGLVLLCQL